jgi:hypothetical protein
MLENSNNKYASIYATYASSWFMARNTNGDYFETSSYKKYAPAIRYVRLS